jgi:hypothetical protein
MATSLLRNVAESKFLHRSNDSLLYSIKQNLTLYSFLSLSVHTHTPRPHNTPAHYEAVVNNIRTKQGQHDTRAPDENYADLYTLARRDGNGHKGGSLSRTSKQRADAIIEAHTRYKSKQPGANKYTNATVVGKGKAITTSASRQRACTKSTLGKYYKLVKAAYEKHPHLESEAGYVLSLDESQILLSGEKFCPKMAVHFDRGLKEWSFGAVRTRAAGAGSNRISLVQCISADGHVYDPGFYVSGKYVSPAWGHGPAPPGVSKKWIEGLWLSPQKAGVATKEGSLVALAEVALAPARARLNKLCSIPASEGTAAGKVIAISFDCPACHGITWDEETGIPHVSTDVQAVLDKYNAIVLPLPHNTSTALSPLDVAYLGMLKQLLRRIFSQLPRCWANPTDHLNVHTLKVIVVELSDADLRAGKRALPAVTRCLNMEGKICMRTVLWAFGVLHTHWGPELSKSAKRGFRDAGMHPLDYNTMVAKGQASVGADDIGGKQRECAIRKKEADVLRERIMLAHKNSTDAICFIQEVKMLTASFQTPRDVLERKYTIPVDADPEWQNRTPRGNRSLKPEDGFRSLKAVKDHPTNVKRRNEGTDTYLKGEAATQKKAKVDDADRKEEQFCDCGGLVPHKRPTHSACLNKKEEGRGLGKGAVQPTEGSNGNGKRGFGKRRSNSEDEAPPAWLSNPKFLRTLSKALSKQTDPLEGGPADEGDSTEGGDDSDDEAY